jgi:hypothetical protein
MKGCNQAHIRFDGTKKHGLFGFSFGFGFGFGLLELEDGLIVKRAGPERRG